MKIGLRPLGVVCLLAATPGFGQDPQPPQGHPPGWVVIPVNEYGALRNKAFPSEREPELGLDATLTRVDYDLKLDGGGIASGTASLTVDVLKDGWVRVPIPQGLLVREARLSGTLVSLVPTGTSGQMAAVLWRKGRSVLTLDVAFAVPSGGGEERLALPAGTSGITRAFVTRPVQDVDVRIYGGFVSEKSPTHWLVYARGNEPLTFIWRRKVDEPQRRVELPLRLRGSLTQLFGLGEDSTSLNAEVQLEVTQGLTRQVKIAVPDSVTINQVPGAMVADWDVKNGELIVNFLEPVDRSAKFTITGETRLPRDGTIAIPLVRLLGVERDFGGVAVEVLGAGEIKRSKTQGLDDTEATELGAMVAARQSPSLAAFRLRTGAGAATTMARSLEVEVARYTPQAVLTANVEEARYRVLMSAGGKMLVQARYGVRNNQRTFMRITLPAGAVVWSASLSGRPIRPGKGPDGSLLFPLAKGRAGEEAPVFGIEILYLARGSEWSAKGRATLALPVLDLPVSRTGVMLFHPPQFRVTPEAGAFRTQPYEAPTGDIWTATEATALLDNGPSQQGVNTKSQDATLSLVNGFRSRSDSRKTAAALPVRVAFPAVGPSLYLVSELTGEGKGATLDLNYQKDKKGGVK